MNRRVHLYGPRFGLEYYGPGLRSSAYRGRSALRGRTKGFRRGTRSRSYVRRPVIRRGRAKSARRYKRRSTRRRGTGLSGFKLLATLNKLLSPKYNFQDMAYGRIEYVSATPTDQISGRCGWYGFGGAVSPGILDLLNGSNQACFFWLFDAAFFGSAQRLYAEHRCEWLRW